MEMKPEAGNAIPYPKIQHSRILGDRPKKIAPTRIKIGQGIF